MRKYIAFLRGINSSGNHTVRMEVLRKIFEDLGFKNFRMLLASGNVHFETDTSDEKIMEQEIGNVLPGVIGLRSISTVENTGSRSIIIIAG